MDAGADGCRSRSSVGKALDSVFSEHASGVRVRQVRGSRCDRRSIFMSLLTGMVAVGDRPQPVEVGERTGRAAMCAR